MFRQKTVLLTLITILLAALQSFLFHIGTTCYGHEIFSIYFFVELFIFLLVVLSQLENKLSVLLYFIIFLFETVYFFLNDLPLDLNFMLIIGVIRIYVFVSLFNKMRSKK